MELIDTIRGQIERSRLVKKEGTSNDGSAWVEYYLDSELVHRSSLVRLRPQEPMGAQTASFGNS